MRKSRLGIPYFEMVLVICVLCVLALVLIERFFYYRELTEKTAFELTVTNMRSGLRLEKARRLIAGESLSNLQDSNPVRYLERLPEAYQGEKNSPELQHMAPGDWIFVVSNGVLYYKPHLRRYLKANTQVIAIHIKNDLQVDTPYQWF